MDVPDPVHANLLGRHPGQVPAEVGPGRDGRRHHRDVLGEGQHWLAGLLDGDQVRPGQPHPRQQHQRHLHDSLPGGVGFTPVMAASPRRGPGRAPAAPGPPPRRSTRPARPGPGTPQQHPVTRPQPATAPERGRDHAVRFGRHGDHAARVAAGDHHASGGGQGQPVSRLPAQRAGHRPVSDPASTRPSGRTRTPRHPGPPGLPARRQPAASRQPGCVFKRCLFAGNFPVWVSEGVRGPSSSKANTSWRRSSGLTVVLDDDDRSVWRPRRWRHMNAVARVHGEAGFTHEPI